MKLATNYEIIKDLRKQRKLTQKQLAQLADIPISSLKMIETNRMQLSQENAEKLARVFNVSPETFYVEIPDSIKTKVITVSIHKGGAGKSSIASGLTATLGLMGYKILAIDTDAQLNFTRSFGLNPNPEKNFYKAFWNGEDIKNHIIPSGYKNIDFVVGDFKLSAIESIINSIPFKEQRMAQILQNVIKENIYDFIIIDTNPTLGSLNISVLNASDEVLIPIEPTSFGIQGLSPFMDHFSVINKFNPNVKILGIVFNKVDTRKIITQEAIDVVKSVFGEHLLKTHISVDVNIEKAQWAMEPLPIFNPRCRATREFRELAKEVLSIVLRR